MRHKALVPSVLHGQFKVFRALRRSPIPSARLHPAHPVPAPGLSGAPLTSPFGAPVAASAVPLASPFAANMASQGNSVANFAWGAEVRKRSDVVHMQSETQRDGQWDTFGTGSDSDSWQSLKQRQLATNNHWFSCPWQCTAEDKWEKSDALCCRCSESFIK